MSPHLLNPCRNQLQTLPSFLGSKYILKLAQRFLCALLCIFVLYYSCCYNPFTFNYSLETSQQYLLTLIFPIFSILFICLYFSSGKLHTSKTFILLILALFILSSLFFSRYYSFSNEHFLAISFFFLFFLFSILWWKHLEISGITLSIIILFYSFQLITGIEQFLLYRANPSRSLLITGTLKNSGIYACYLVAQLPFVYYVLFNFKFYPIISIESSKLALQLRKRKKIILVIKRCFLTILISVTLVLVGSTQSRTGIISIMTLSTAYCFLNKKLICQDGSKRIRAFIRNLVILCFFTIVAVVLLIRLADLKPLSSSGRLFKLQIFLDHLTDHFWTGTGLGRFTWYYPQWQAQYFQSHSSPLQEYYLSANESYLLFNEYLQLFKETGLVGICIFLILITFSLIKSAQRKNHLLDAAKLTLITVLSCGFTSYPFHVNILLFLLGFSFSIILAENELHISNKLKLAIAWKKLNQITLYFIIALSLMTSFKGIRNYWAITVWNYSKISLSLNQIEENKVYEIMKDDGKFLTDYANYLLQTTQSLKAVEVLERAKLSFLSKSTVEASGYAYKQIGSFDRAIENFYWLSSYLPHHFRPKLELLRLYIKIGNINRAKAVANNIVIAHVKVKSSEVDLIKSEAIKFLESLDY